MVVLGFSLTFLEDNLLTFDTWKNHVYILKNILSLMQGISRNKYPEWVEKSRVVKFTYPFLSCIQSSDTLTQSLIFMSVFHSFFHLFIW